MAVDGHPVSECRLDERVSLGTFHFNHHKSRTQLKTRILRLLDLDFVRNGTSVVLIGNPGVGKTFLGKIIGWRACQANQRVLFTTAMDMLNHLLASQVDHSLVRKLKFYTEPSLLMVDELGFQYEDDARCFKEALHDRFRQFSLELHPEKTRLLRFGRFAHRDCRRFDGKRKPETFDFLGFTHACGVNQGGKFLVRRTTMRKQLTAKLHEVKAELLRRRHQPVSEQGRWLQSVVRGYFAYHAIPGNWKALGSFRTQCVRLWYKALRRRSQKSRLTWERMTQIADAWIPPARILHPWPEQRLAALIRGKSRMQ